MSWHDYFFFFQAEDSIRGIGVTGVQTCALPISRVHDDLWLEDPRAVPLEDLRATGRRELEGADVVLHRHRRSEERRVGKNSVSWGLLYPRRHSRCSQAYTQIGRLTPRGHSGQSS